MGGRVGGRVEGRVGGRMRGRPEVGNREMKGRKL